MPAPKGHTKWGGRRMGAKNKETLEREELRRIFQERVRGKWNDLIEIQLQEAMKDTRARQYVFDQMIGKPVEVKEIGSSVELIMDI